MENPTATEVRVTSPTGAQKGKKLARFDLIPAGPLTTVATLYGVGAEKYAERNWEAGYDWSLSYAAMQRHAWAHWSGEEIDPETELPHLAAVVFHALAQMEFMTTHREYDNRPSTAKLEKPEPRVWESLSDISPPHVIAKDSRGYRVQRVFGGWWYLTEKAWQRSEDSHGPFTEVLI